jgi:hypothetical protein
MQFLLLAALVSAIWAPPRSAMDFVFPSRDRHAVSPSNSLAVTYQDPGINSDGIHEYRLVVSDARGAALATLSFTRSVEGSWSPDGRRLILNNYIGSNLNDCLITRPNRRSPALVSITSLLRRRGNSSAPHARTITTIPEGPENSHFSLTCSRWIDNNTVEILIAGYVDAEPNFGHEFRYRLRFSPATETFRRIQ